MEDLCKWSTSKFPLFVRMARLGVGPKPFVQFDGLVDKSGKGTRYGFAACLARRMASCRDRDFQFIGSGFLDYPLL